MNNDYTVFVVYDEYKRYIDDIISGIRKIEGLWYSKDAGAFLCKFDDSANILHQMELDSDSVYEQGLISFLYEYFNNDSDENFELSFGFDDDEKFCARFYSIIEDIPEQLNTNQIAINSDWYLDIKKHEKILKLNYMRDVISQSIDPLLHTLDPEHYQNGMTKTEDGEWMVETTMPQTEYIDRMNRRINKRGESE